MVSTLFKPGLGVHDDGDHHRRRYRRGSCYLVVNAYSVSVIVDDTVDEGKTEMVQQIVHNLGAKRAAAKQADRARLDRLMANGADGMKLNSEVGLVSPNRKPVRKPKRLGRGSLKQAVHA